MTPKRISSKYSSSCCYNIQLFIIDTSVMVVLLSRGVSLLIQCRGLLNEVGHCLSCNWFIMTQCRCSGCNMTMLHPDLLPCPKYAVCLVVTGTNFLCQISQIFFIQHFGCYINVTLLCTLAVAFDPVETI